MKKIVLFFMLIYLPLTFAHTFQVGETLEYNIYALGWKAAHHVVRIDGIVNVNGREAYKISSHIKTYPFVERFYKLNDTVYAYMDTKTLQLLKFEAHKEEGNWKDYAFGTNCLAGQKLYYYDKGKNLLVLPYKKPLLDLVSMIFYGRTLDLKVGKKHTFSIVDHRKISSITTLVKSVSKRRIHALDRRKKFSTIRIQEIGGKDVGVWFTDDADKIPFQIVSMKIKILGLSLGSVKSVLIKYKKK